MHFPTTQWTLLAEATLHGDAAGQAALADLCQLYRPAVLSFVRTRGLPPEEAEDATQDFFQSLMETKWWRRARPDGGRFRNFLCGALLHQLNNRARAQRALKRGGSDQVVNLDDLDLAGENAPSVEPALGAAFDHAWASLLVERAVGTLEAEYAERGQADKFEVLRAFLPGAQEILSQEEAASALGVPVTAFRVDLSRLRTRLREQIRREVTRTVGSLEDVEEELRYLQRIMLEAPNSAHFS